MNSHHAYRNWLLGMSLGGLLLIGTGCFLGCSVEEQSSSGSAGGSTVSGELKGEIAIDGSSTVYPISLAIAEEFKKLHEGVNTTVSYSGTGGGFKRFARGETAISDASRPIKDSEVESCKENGIDFVELKVAIDGLTVMVNPKNDWCDGLTVAQLKSIWEKDSKITRWNQINPEWPDHKIELYGPDTESGTYDYFNEVICGENGSRTDYEPSVNDNDLVVGIANQEYALGYFGYAYYVENKGKLKALKISNTDDPAAGVAPTDATVESGEYAPLSRPLFIYVNKAELKRPEVAAFVEFFLDKGQEYVRDVGYVALKAEVVEEMKARLSAAKSSAPPADPADTGESSESKPTGE